VRPTEAYFPARSATSGSRSGVSQVIRVGAESFSSSIEHFSFALDHIENADDLKNLLLFPNLRSASFGGTNLDDVGLKHVSRVLTLEDLNLQCTSITDDGLAYLENLHGLRHLRLKENPQLTNACVPHLLRLSALVDLQIHETSIDQHGLNRLDSMKNLRGICIDVWRENYSFEMLLALSVRMPACTILAKGRGEFLQGRFDGVWHV
jgi:hypothetical protein